MGKPAILLVEGHHDGHVVGCLLGAHGIREPFPFRIKPKEGVSKLLEDLDVELEASDLERLGIIVDADTDLDARWAALRNRLVGCGYTVPHRPDPDGLILSQPGRPKVGVWLMPDNTLPGMLEHFVSFLIPTGDPLWNRAVHCVAQIPEPERRFAPQHEIKARVHTWLAWQEDPGTPMGQAITKCYLDGEAPHARRLLTWLRRLFEM